MFLMLYDQIPYRRLAKLSKEEEEYVRYKGIDVEQIKGSQFMDRQDRQYFEKHGAPLKSINMSENNSREGSI